MISHGLSVGNNLLVGLGWFLVAYLSVNATDR
jgi:hypothetical protein